jgi:hypothetical protein
MTNADNNNLVIDGAVSVGALTLPWWAQLLGEWVALAVTLLTFLLIIFRLILAYRELKRG